MNIKTLALTTDTLQEVKSFYHDLLGFTILNENKKIVSFKIGESILTFQLSNEVSNPTYHFAFNIPENQVQEAQNWLSSKLELQLDEQGNSIIDFPNWNAQALYFFDTVGNIVEFIARHDLDNASDLPFSAGSILNISEIGLPADDVNALAKNIQQHSNLPTYKSGSSQFHPIGDENGLFICVPTDRVWYMTDDLKSAIFPVAIEVEEIKNSFNFDLYFFHKTLR